MKLKQYRRIKLFFVVLITIISSQAVIHKVYLLPIVAILISTLVLLSLRKRVKEVMADERDYLMAGKAAIMALQIYAWVAVVAMFILYAYRDSNPAYEPMGMILAFSTCLLMLLYSLIFRYFNRTKFSEKK